MSGQSRSGGAGGMQTSGYEASHRPRGADVGFATTGVAVGGTVGAATVAVGLGDGVAVAGREVGNGDAPRVGEIPSAVAAWSRANCPSAEVAVRRAAVSAREIGSLDAAQPPKAPATVTASASIPAFTAFIVTRL